MNLKNLLTKLSLLVVFFTAFTVSTFAQSTYYVSATNGNDLVFPGTQAQPFQTIGKALATAADGDVINVFADTYNEGGAQLAITKTVTLNSLTFNASNVVIITNGIQINGAGKTVSLGNGTSLQFNLGSTATALTLTAGTLNITSANVIVAGGGTITRASNTATISATPTTTNVNVVYNGAADITSGPELPASLGTGTLTINMAATKTLTVGSNLTIGAGQIITALTNAGNATFTGNVSVAGVPNAIAIRHQTGGTVTFNNVVNFSHSAAVATLIQNDAGGTVTLTGGVSTTNYAVGLNNAAAGTIKAGAGTYGGPVNNDAGGTIELLASATFSNAVVSNNNAGSIIKLNSNQLTLSATAGGPTLTNAGKVISATASTVGNGLLLVSGTFTANGGGELPNVTITGKLTLGANTTLFGNFTLSSATAGALTDGGFTLSVAGNFTRTDNTVGNYVTSAGTSNLTFVGTANQTFNPGASLVLNNVTINNTGGAGANIVTMAASVSVAGAGAGAFTITAGKLNLADYNITMTGATAQFNNGGSFYSSTGNGYLIMQGQAQILLGAGAYGNMLVNTQGGANTVTLGASPIKFSGILVLYKGALTTGANTFTLTADNVAIPSIRLKTDGVGSLNAAGGVVNTAVGVVYNLEYFGNASIAAGGEWINAAINNLWINTTTGANTVTGPAGASNVAGVLTVNAGQTLAQGAVVFTLSGNNMAHNVPGSVTGGTLTVTGNGSSITGSTVGANAAAVNNLIINVGAGNTFTSTNLKSIAALTNTTGNSTITMNTTTAAITGNLTLTAGNLTLAMGSAAAQQVVGGTATLTAGTLTLGSNISVTGQTSQVAGNLVLSTFNYTQLGSAATPDYNRTGAGTVTGTGTLVFNATAAAIDFTPGATFTVPNLNMIAAANGITMNAAFTVSNSLTHTSGTVAYSNITLAGPTYHYVAGTITGTFTVTNTASTLTFDASTAIPTFVINAPGGTVTVVNGTAGAKTVTVSTAFTLTDGTLVMGNNDLAITGTFTRVAGGITQIGGHLIFNNGALNFVTGTGFTVDNLEIQANATNLADNNVYGVNKNLFLTAGTLTNDEKLTLANGALITVNAGLMTSTGAGLFPTYVGVIDVIYIGVGAYAAGNEIPGTASVLRNLTVNNAAAAVTLTNGATVNGTFYLKNGGFTIPATKTLTLVAGGTWQQGVGVLTVTGTLAKTTYNLIYSDGFAAASTNTEFPASATNILSLTLQNAGTMVTLNNSKTVNGPVTLNDGGIILFGGNNTLAAIGNVTVNNGGFENGNAGTTGKLQFAGAAAQTFTVPAGGLTFPIKTTAGATVEINNAAGVTLAGGNLTMLDPAAASVAPAYAAADKQTSIFSFVNGVFSTGANTLVLWQTNNVGVPVQGYVRTAGHVNGNVKKYLDATGAYYGATLAQAAIALTRVEFPVGSATNYKPMAFQFNTLPTANFNLTVNEVEATPAGTNGFPITSGTIQLANYPGFYWLVTSDLTLQPQVKYDIEAEANGYGPTNYPEGVQNIRFLRRFDNATTNPWVLQGGLSYDNSTNGDHAKIIVRSAEGAISTQGARFTYSQAAKAPTVTTPLAAVAVNENSPLTVVWTGTSLNLGGTSTFGATPVWTATAPAVVPTNATFNAATGTLTWTPTYTQSGVYTVTVTATDGTLSTTNTVTITVNNVNRPPSFALAGATTLATKSMKSNEVFNFTYAAVDPDAEAITYSVAVTGPAFAGTATIAAALGTLTFTPTFADAGKVFTVTVTATDPNGATATTVTAVTVTYPVAKGDVNGNGAVGAEDAALILQYVVGLYTPADMALWNYVADVNSSGSVGALDAAWILYYVTHSNTWPTDASAKAVAVMGSVEFGKFASENGVISLPINILNTSGVTSVSSEIELNGNVEFDGVDSKLPEGWIVFKNYSNGKLRIAMAGADALTSGNLAVLKFKLKDKESSINVLGNAKLNDNVNAELNAVKVKEIPTSFALSQNYPNPFNPTTTIKYQVAENAKVSLTIYDMLGQKVKTLIDNEQEAGYYTVRWDGTNESGSKVTSGIYIYRLTAGKFTSTIKMNLLK